MSRIFIQKTTFQDLGSENEAHAAFDFLKGDGTVVGAFHTDAAGLGTGVGIGGIAVDMSEEIAIGHVAVEVEGLMGEQPEGFKEDGTVIDLFKAAVTVPLGAAGVVVAHDQTDMSLESGEDLSGFFLAVEGEIPQQIDGILRGNSFIPAADEFLIHLFSRGKGTVLIANDIGMAEMGIGSEKDSGHTAPPIL